ncbi:hypothetical protein [Anaerotruncus sp. 80]|uniref:hypothetical protein n=1 Tax=Anaerotruncus sp. 80 TaxID=2304566 RepID=UPI001A9B4185|nr:hypothetical protein [Anaerotruncus sp. 80]
MKIYVCQCAYFREFFEIYAPRPKTTVDEQTRSGGAACIYHSIDLHIDDLLYTAV